MQPNLLKVNPSKLYVMLLTKTLFILFGSLLLASSPVVAQNASAVKEVQASGNLLAYLMIAVALILAFVIWGMGNVLLILIRQVLDKQKNNAPGIFSFVFLIGFSLISLPIQAQNNTEAAVKELPNYGGLDGTAFWLLVATIGIEILAIGFMLFFIKRIQQELLPEKITTTSSLAAWWAKVDKKLFTQAVPVEKEADVMLDHNYDGIRELDNALPPWWKWGFVITIIFSFFYLFHFHVMGSGKNPTEEYMAELKQAEVELKAFAAKNKDKIDEDNIVMADESGILAGKEIYQQVCWACHGKEGEGGAGPNLTDNFWIHKGSLNDIYRSIKLGYPEKGMQSWEKLYSPKQMSDLTSYIETFKGTQPANPKPAQGELYIAVEPVVADSITK
jgi:cytochrome c oxidase cbb3-type subunit 3